MTLNSRVDTTPRNRCTDGSSVFHSLLPADVAGRLPARSIRRNMSYSFISLFHLISRIMSQYRWVTSHCMNIGEIRWIYLHASIHTITYRS